MRRSISIDDSHPPDRHLRQRGVTTNYVKSVGYYPHGALQFWQCGNRQNVNKVLTSWEVWATQNNNGNNWMFVAYNGFDNSQNVISQTEGFGMG